MDFKTLYGKSSVGKFKEWSVFVEEEDGKAYIITITGYTDGKKIQSRREATPKNVGKKNETTALQQAQLEAKKRWNDKKKKDGYRESLKELENKLIILPMLAQKYDPLKNKRKTIKFPCFAQPKLDGIRCIAFLENNKINLISRKNHTFLYLDHIRAELEPIFAKNKSIYFDGELYTDQITFQELTGIIKTEKIDNVNFEILDTVEYHIFDMFDINNMKLIQEERLNWLKNNVKNTIHLKLVKTIECKLETDVDLMHDIMVQEGYEGLMLKNKDGLYKLNYRSPDVQKVKKFIDNEFPIVGFSEGTGTRKGTIIWHVEVGKRITKAEQVGQLSYSRNLFKLAQSNFKQFKGKLLTVRYFGKTDDNSLRFPKGIAIRNYE